jgi:ABC-2 type transport system permease protein
MAEHGCISNAQVSLDFFKHSDVSVTVSIVMILTDTIIYPAIITWIFRTGYGLKK